MAIAALITRGYGSFGSISEVVTRGYINLGPAANITGSATETNIVGQVFGGTLVNDTLLPAGTGPIGSIANTQALIDGLVSNQSDPFGFNALRSTIAVTDVIRISDTQWSLTIPSGFSIFEISADETLTWTIPADVLTSAVAIIGTPGIFILANIPVFVEKHHTISFLSNSRGMDFTADQRRTEFSSASRSVTMVCTDEPVIVSHIVKEDGFNLLFENGNLIRRE